MAALALKRWPKFILPLRGSSGARLNVNNLLKMQRKS
jgi:hypothetical protein